MQQRNRTQRRKRTAGMTLIEVMVVMVIMASIAAAVGFAVINHLEHARERSTEMRARTVRSAAIAFLIDQPGECPAMDDLDDILDQATDSSDGWGRPFTIACEGNTILVRSAGRDGTPGTDDDIEI